MTHSQQEMDVYLPKTIDRRRFVRNMVTTAAWWTTGALTAHAADEIRPIQWLGKAHFPRPISGMTYLRASEIGCALDCDLSTGSCLNGSGPATDDAPKINAALAFASADNPITLILDGPALISGLFLPPGGHWHIAGLGRGTGFFVAEGTNNDAVRNADPNLLVMDPGPPAPPRGSDVSLTNFTLNVNRGDGHSGDSTSGAPIGGRDWYMGIDLMNLDHIRIEDLVIVNSPSYHIRLSNVGHVTVKGCVLDSRGLHTDGVHFNGPANDLAIEDCSFALQDDAIALNCPEGYSGDIERVTIRNCKFDSFSALRLYTLAGTGGRAFHLQDVSMTGCNGKTVAEAFLLAGGITQTPESIDGITISDCEFTSPALLDLAVNFGTVVVRNVRWTPSGPVDTGYALARTSRYDRACTYKGTSLTFQDCTIVRQRPDIVSGMVVTSRSHITAVTFNGLRVEDPPGADFPICPQLVTIVSGTLGQLRLERVDSAHIDSMVEPGRIDRVGEVVGSGVLVGGWERPNRVMAKNSL